jgi:diguanylate cyclase (GGDEF)-like protein
VVDRRSKPALPATVLRGLARALLLVAAVCGPARQSSSLPDPARDAPAGHRASVAVPVAQPLLTRIADIKKLVPAEAAKSLPVRIDAVVLYYQPREEMLYVQDATGAIYIRNAGQVDIHQGSRVIISGYTSASYRNAVWSTGIRSIGEAPLPAPKAAGFSDLINGAIDCDLVQVKGIVRSSTIQKPDGTPFLLLEMLVDGGPITVHVLHYKGVVPDTYLDARISLAGAAGKEFDGKFEPVGAKVYVDDVSAIHVLSTSKISPLDIPLSSIDRVDQNYSANNTGQRIRVRGTVTLYDPGEMLVLDQQGKTLLVHTHQDDPLAIGQTVDAIGFSDYADYAPSLTYGEFFPTSTTESVTPQPMTYDEVMTGKHSFTLISLTGVLVDEVNETKQDTLVIRSGEHVFSAVFRSPQDLPHFEVGSNLRVTGVCLIEAYGPYNQPVDFTLRMRSPADSAVLTLPSWITVRKLGLIAVLLLGLVVAALVWAEMLRHRVASQTRVIRRRAEEDAAWERRTVYLEKERSGVLEAINSTQPLDAVLALIAAFIGKQIQGVTCSFHLIATAVGVRSTDLTPYGLPTESASTEQASIQYAAAEAAVPVPERYTSSRSIRSRDGQVSAEMLLVTEGKWRSNAHTEEVLDIGSRLAALAIENRKLHEQLVRRSGYDQLTDVPNRFLIEERLECALAEAEASGGHLAVVYVDLDDFKRVNDVYGHRVGDLYLKQTAQRLAAQLRDRDMIARIGGDEFLAIIHSISGREEAEGVARRLASCFAHPFTVEEHKLEGSASIGIAVYPDDGLDGEQLKRTADHAMYALKRENKVTPISAAS